MSVCLGLSDGVHFYPAANLCDIATVGIQCNDASICFSLESATFCPPPFAAAAHVVDTCGTLSARRQIKLSVVHFVQFDMETHAKHANNHVLLSICNGFAVCCSCGRRLLGAGFAAGTKKLNVVSNIAHNNLGKLCHFAFVAFPTRADSG